MKKSFFLLFFLLGTCFINVSSSFAQEDIVKFEIPVKDNFEQVDVKYGNKIVSSTTNPKQTVKNAANKTADVTKSAAQKTADGTKSFTQKTVEVTKSAAKKTAEGAKNITNITIEETRDFIEDLNLPSEVTVENLEKQASIKTLKNEKKSVKAAYNSRIKDTKAKIKLLQKSTNVSDVEKQNKIYTYEKQIVYLEQKRDNEIKKYDARINDLKNSK